MRHILVDCPHCGNITLEVEHHQGGKHTVKIWKTWAEINKERRCGKCNMILGDAYTSEDAVEDHQKYCRPKP